MDPEVVLRSIVRIHAYSKPVSFARPFQVLPRVKGVGSGFFVDLPVDGHVCALTCAHVVETADVITVILPNRGNTDMDASVRRFIPSHMFDLAVICIPDPEGEIRRDCNFLELGNSDEMKLRQTLIAYGFPLGQTNLKASDGVYSGFEGRLQHTVSISPGNSGGPLMDERGRVVGINSSGVAAVEASNIGYAVPINLFRENIRVFTELAPAHTRDVTPDRVWRIPGFGFVLHTTTPAQLGGAPHGLYVFKVLGGSAAEGIVEVGDVISHFGGDEVDNNGDVKVSWNSQRVPLQSVMERSVNPNASYMARIWRGGVGTDVWITPTDFKTAGLRMLYPPYDEVPFLVFMGMCLMEFHQNHCLTVQTFSSCVGKNVEELLVPKLIISHIFEGTTLSKTDVFTTGDFVVSVCGVAVSTLEEFREAVGQCGETVTVKTEEGRQFSMSTADIVAEERGAEGDHVEQDLLDRLRGDGPSEETTEVDVEEDSQVSEPVSEVENEYPEDEADDDDVEDVASQVSDPEDSEDAGVANDDTQASEPEEGDDELNVEKRKVQFDDQ